MKEIPLTQGKVALVDDEDYEELSKYKWYAIKGKVTYYAVRNIKAPTKSGQRMIQMHQVITGKLGMDHADGDGLNNQKYNLRDVVENGNSWNRRPQAKGSSIYKGVSKRRDNAFIAGIRQYNKRIHLGTFSSEVEAAKAYDVKARELFGEFARTNF